MSKFGLFGKFIAKEGQRDAFVQILLEAAEALESFDGCELYVVNVSDEDPNAVWVTEVWRDESDHQASLALPETKAAIQRAMPMIAGMGERYSFRPVGGKGL